MIINSEGFFVLFLNCLFQLSPFLLIKSFNFRNAMYKNPSLFKNAD